jgi:hypothetical protein
LLSDKISFVRIMRKAGLPLISTSHDSQFELLAVDCELFSMATNDFSEDFCGLGEARKVA